MNIGELISSVKFAIFSKLKILMDSFESILKKILMNMLYCKCFQTYSGICISSSDTTKNSYIDVSLYGRNNILYYVLINVHVDVSGYLISKKPATGSRCFVKFSIANQLCLGRLVLFPLTIYDQIFLGFRSLMPCSVIAQHSHFKLDCSRHFHPTFQSVYP